MPETERRIDADVHCPAPNADALGPYLAEHWRAYLAENGFKQPSSVGYSYPAGSAVMAGAPATMTVETVREHVLDRSAYAVLNCFYGSEGIRHPYLAAALTTAVNRWLQEQWLDREPRLVGSLVIPAQDTEASVAEIKRAAKSGRFAQVLLPARAWEPYGNHRYWPIWDAAVEHGLALGIQFGGLTGNPATSVGSPETYFEEYTATPQLFAAHVMSLIVEGVFDRWPDLRVSLVESGVSWLPTWMWKLDTDWRSSRREIPWVRESPSHYVRRHFRLTTQPFDGPASTIPDILEQLGSDDVLMYSSDYPHRHGSSSDALLPLLSPAQRAKVLFGNAWDFYALGDRVRGAAVV